MAGDKDKAAGRKTPARKTMPAAEQRQLWVNAHGLCSNAECRRSLIIEATAADAAITTGEQAHVVGHSKDGPHGISPLPQGQRETYANMILLCGYCHTKVDGQPSTYTREVLLSWKETHEDWVRSCMMLGMTNIAFQDLEAVTARFAGGDPVGSTPEVATDISKKALLRWPHGSAKSYSDYRWRNRGLLRRTSET